MVAVDSAGLPKANIYFGLLWYMVPAASPLRCSDPARFKTPNHEDVSVINKLCFLYIFMIDATNTMRINCITKQQEPKMNLMFSYFRQNKKQLPKITAD